MRHVLIVIPILTVLLAISAGCANRCQPACPPAGCSPGLLPGPRASGFYPGDDAFSHAEASPRNQVEGSARPVNYREVGYRVPLR